MGESGVLVFVSYQRSTIAALESLMFRVKLQTLLVVVFVQLPMLLWKLLKVLSMEQGLAWI